jgi:hypothetical protein
MSSARAPAFTCAQAASGTMKTPSRRIAIVHARIGIAGKSRIFSLYGNYGSDFNLRAVHSGRSNDMMTSSLWTPPKKALPRAIPSTWKPMAW